MPSSKMLDCCMVSVNNQHTTQRLHRLWLECVSQGAILHSHPPLTFYNYGGAKLSRSNFPIQLNVTFKTEVHRLWLECVSQGAILHSHPPWHSTTMVEQNCQDPTFRFNQHTTQLLHRLWLECVSQGAILHSHPPWHSTTMVEQNCQDPTFQFN